jgi:hypothetical protein
VVQILRDLFPIINIDNVERGKAIHWQAKALATHSWAQSGHYHTCADDVTLPLCDCHSGHTSDPLPPIGSYRPAPSR